MKVLVLSRNYPNRVLPTLGLWVDALVRHSTAECEPCVVSPVPYCPPLPGRFGYYTRYRSIPAKEDRGGVWVLHPRFLLGPGYSTHRFEALSYLQGVTRSVDRLRDTFRFDLIHAHFGYPDGVVAARLAERYGVPFVITEHAFWTPWMNQYPSVRCQAVEASQRSAFHVAVSQSLRKDIASYAGGGDRLRVVHLGAEFSRFAPGTPGEVDPNQILFVGYINYTKGVDLLLKAMVQLVRRNPALRLVLVGGGLYRHKQKQEEGLHRMARDLNLTKNVEFAGAKSPDEVAAYMRTSALLVSASRRETFGAVLVEALASGLPVVATRCGGPEDIITDEVGVLVRPEDPDAIAAGIASALSRRERYDPYRLRAYATENFSWPHLARQTTDLYEAAIEKVRGGVSLS